MATKNPATNTNPNQTAIERTRQPDANGQIARRGKASDAADQEVVYTPLMDVVETRESYLLQADLPGVDPADLDVSFHEGTLTLEAPVKPRQQGDQRYLLREYGIGRFYRTVGLGNAIDPDGIRAELKNGVLSVFVPKARSAKPRRIEVKG